MSILITYYEKITADLINKLHLDMKTFIIQEKVAQDCQRQSKEYKKFMELYLKLINDSKDSKSINSYNITNQNYPTFNNNPNYSPQNRAKTPNTNNSLASPNLSPVTSPKIDIANKENLDNPNIHTYIDELNTLKTELSLYKSENAILKLENNKLDLEKQNIQTLVRILSKPRSQI